MARTTANNPLLQAPNPGFSPNRRIPAPLSGLLAALAILLLFLEPVRADQEKWVVYYSDKAGIDLFEPFDLIVFDNRYHPPMERLRERSKTLLGYLSLGEVEKGRHYFDAVKKEGLLLMENGNWPGSHLIDVRQPQWIQRVLEKLIPAILHAGFHGLFLDTLDNPGHLERLDPKRFSGMRLAGLRLVKAIRYHYPFIPIMMNRGFDLLPELLFDVDMVLAESIRSHHDFRTGAVRMVPEAEFRETAAMLRRLKERRPALRIHSLDYWKPDDPEGIRKIYRQQRDMGFIPYVATVNLDTIIPEPEP